MKRSEERILTTHVGSMVRPAHLVAPAGSTGGFSMASSQERFVPGDAELRDAVRDVVAEQAGCGLDVVNDGEYGKVSWSAYILDRISGFEVQPDRLKPLVWLGRDRERFKGFFAESEMASAVANGAPAEVCVGPVAYVDERPVRRDLANLVAASRAAGLEEQGKEPFFTSVAPASTAYQGIDEYYGDEEAYVYAIADALAVEYRLVHESGVLLQVDDAVLANMYDHLIQQGESVWRRWAQLRVEALNHALAGIPPERVRYHVCFGSWHVPHVADAPLAAILPLMLQVNAGGYSIEAANARHEHEHRLWEDTVLPDDKVLLPGVITHHTTTVEHPELVALRIERFAALLGRERVIASSDCGFAQSSRLQRVHPEVMWAKFRALTEGAAIASSHLWH
jgi:5-methyltetrahydropteroyltriglutamate--homocysteine methyltransferase